MTVTFDFKLFVSGLDMQNWSFSALGNFKISVWNNLSLGIRFSTDPIRTWNRLMIFAVINQRQYFQSVCELSWKKDNKLSLR